MAFTLGASLLMRGKAMLLGAGKSAVGDIGKDKIGQPAKKKTIDSKKLLPSSSKTKEQHTISDEDVQNISIAATQLMDIDTILKGSLVLDKMRAKKENKAKEKKKRNLKEKMGEGLKNIGKGIGDRVKKVGSSMMDWINRLIFGAIMISLFKMADVIKPILPIIATMVDGLIMITGWLFNAASTLIHWGYMIYDGIAGFIKNIFGEAGLKVFENLMGALNTFMNAAIAAVMALIKFKWLRGFAKNIVKRLGKLISKIPGVKQIGNLAKGIGKKAVNLVKGVGSKVAGAGQKLLGAGKGLATKGASKVGGFAAKLFGKAAKVITPAFKAAKPFVSKFFGRVPIVGPLIVGIVSLLSGEGAGKAIFKMVGAALGGFLGGALAAGVTTATVGLGALISPAMVMLGELIGVFVGDMLYELIFGGGLASIMGKLKKLVGDVFKKALNVGGAIVDFIKNGLTNFIKDFPTIPIPDIKPGAILASIIEKVPFGKRILGLGVPFTDWNVKGALNSLPGLQEFLGFFAQAVPGLNTYVEDGALKKIPNLLLLTPPGLPFLIPHVAKSFFGGKDEGADMKGSAKEFTMDSKSKKKKDKGLNKRKLVSYLKFKSEEKHEKEEEKKKEAAELKEKQKADITKKIQTFMQLPLDGKKESPVGEKSPEDKSSSLQDYPTYDSKAPQTAMMPLPPKVIPAGESGGNISINVSGSGEDPFEALYAHSGGVV